MNLLLLSAALSFSSLTFAMEKAELIDLDPCNIVLGGSDVQLAETFFRNFSHNYQDGLGLRGFMGGAIPNTPENALIALDYGLVWWGMRWNFASSVEEAIEHRLKARRLHEAKGTPYTDRLVAGQYFIGREEELGLSISEENPQALVPPEKIAELMSRGAWEVDDQGNAVYVEPARLARRMSLNGTKFSFGAHLPGAFGKNSIMQEGWVAFKQHGLHDHNQWRNSEKAKELRKLARQLYAEGWKIRWDTDHEAMLNMIRDQERTYRDQTVDEGGNLIKKDRVVYERHTARYTRETVYKPMLALLLAGKGYSGGLYDPQGRLRGCEIGLRRGNHFYGDSVGYDGRVEYAQIVALELMDILDAAGMPYTDPGMVTAYTASMGAKLVPFPEFMQKIKSGPREKIILPKVWDSRSEKEIEAALMAVFKKKDHGLGKEKFIRRTPVVDDLAVAERVGLSRVRMNIVFVPSPEQASADAATRSLTELPIYIERAEPLTPGLSPLEQLSAALQAPTTKAYYIGSARHPEIRRALPLRTLNEVFEPAVTANAPEWKTGTANPEFSIEGWGFKGGR